MSEIVEILVDEARAGERLDRIIAEKADELTRSYAQNLIKKGCVKVDGQVVADKNFKVQSAQAIEIELPEPEVLDLASENIPLDVIYEDGDLLIVNKPKGMVVHPAPGNYRGTLVNALLHHCGQSLSSINGTIRPGIVHRIDKDTSGLLIVAKNDFAHKSLAEQIKEHSFSREYEAVVYGSLKSDSGRIDAPIGRHKYDRKKMAVTQEHSRNAVTHYEVLARYRGFTHIRLKLETGRTHQIRVHMAYIGHPVAGDPVYGPTRGIKELRGQCLHARHIGFVHPRSSQYMSFESELPGYFKDFLKRLNTERLI